MKINTSSVKAAIEKIWPKLSVKIFDEGKDDAFFIVDLGDDYTKVFMCSDEKIKLSRKHDVYVFISTGNDEIKDTTVFKKDYDFDPALSAEENFLAILANCLNTYGKTDKDEWQPLIDDLKQYHTPDPCAGSHTFELIEDILGTKYA